MALQPDDRRLVTVEKFNQEIADAAGINDPIMAAAAQSGGQFETVLNNTIATVSGSEIATPDTPARVATDARVAAGVAPKADQSYVDTNMAPVSLATQFAALKDDPYGFGYIPTYTMFTVNTSSPQTWSTANDIRYVQCLAAGTIVKIGFWVEAASGNISVAVFRKNGTGRSAVPGTRVSTSGAVAMSSLGGTGYKEITLPAPIRVEKGDYLALSSDNITASFTGMNGSSRANLGPMSFGENGAHPAPAVASPFATTGKTPYLVGLFS